MKTQRFDLVSPEDVDTAGSIGLQQGIGETEDVFDDVRQLQIRTG